MSTFYKVFLIIFIVLTGINLYALDWKIGFLHEDNKKFVFSIVAGLLGVLITIVMNTWRKISDKK